MGCEVWELNVDGDVASGRVERVGGIDPRDCN